MTIQTFIENIIEPKILLLSWQQPASTGSDRLRRFVAELEATSEGVVLTYLTNTKEFEEAKRLGFVGYPGFEIADKKIGNVLSAFMRRLPPRKRKDFERFLTAFRINPKEKDAISDFALLGYSSAALPSDGFSIVNDFRNAEVPFELLIHIQGYRYYAENLPYNSMVQSMTVAFRKDEHNDNDKYAVAAEIDGKKIGYVCRGLNTSFRKWIDRKYSIEAHVERINGTEQNPKIYVFVKVRV